MSNLRASFIERFSETDAIALEEAAAGHRDYMLDGDQRGEDEFADAFSVCVGWECLSKYREAHGIEVSTEELREWARESRVLDRVIGPVDYLALLVGAYLEWVPDDVRAELASSDGGAS